MGGMGSTRNLGWGSLVESGGFIRPYTITLVTWVYNTLTVWVTLAILDEVHLVNPVDLLDHTHSLWSLGLQHLDGVSSTQILRWGSLVESSES